MKAIIVTGLSGAGKTQAIDCLEDMGYYCVDNMPPALIKSFIELASNGKGIEKAAFVIDVRGGALFDDLKGALEDLRKAGVDYKILYFEASEKVLARRYNETRRAHPLAEGGSVLSGIRKEKKMLQELRDASDFVIDTSDMKTAQLSAYISELVATEQDKRGFVINIMSFGYKNGMPISADMVFDARFIPNPFYVKSLKNLTGNNKKVSQFVLKHDITQHFLEKIEVMIIQLIPYYMNEGRDSESCSGSGGQQTTRQ